MKEFEHVEGVNRFVARMAEPMRCINIFKKVRLDEKFIGKIEFTNSAEIISKEDQRVVIAFVRGYVSGQTYGIKEVRDPIIKALGLNNSLPTFG